MKITLVLTFSQLSVASWRDFSRPKQILYALTACVISQDLSGTSGGNEVMTLDCG